MVLSSATLQQQKKQKTQDGYITVSKPGKGSEPKKLSEKVFEYVVNNIATGAFKPAKKISQRRLASTLNVSQFPIREALEKLEQHG